MKLSWTLSAYIARQFMMFICIALAGLVAVAMMVDIVELIRRASGKDSVTFGIIMQLSLLKAPSMTCKLLPYAVLVGSMLALTRLTRTHELVVARSAGVSVWQFLAPAMAVVMCLGVFMTTSFNPFSAALLLRYEQIEGKYFSGRPSLLSISPSGLWLRQIEKNGEHIINSMRLNQNDMSFASLIVFTFNNDKQFVERLDAERAVLEPGVLRLTKVRRSVPGQPPENIDEYPLPTTLTLGHIQDSFASPETMSFWSLPPFISMLEEAGFSALRHRLYWHSLLADPFLLAASVLIAAIFSLRLPRRGKIGLMVVAGVVCGFLLHFFTELIFGLGSAGTLPVALAAWSPAAVMAMAGAAMMLHLEDG